MKLRTEALRAIEGKSFDVCVIGGGATGAGCALDSQLRGLKTVLLEACDFGSGASSASTKMAHGGVRYLERAIRGFDLAEYAIVRRALRERLCMLRNAPYLTRVMEFFTPCFSWVDAAYFGTGLKLYDWVSGRASLGPSRFISRDETLRRTPSLNPERLIGAVTYSDGQFDDARYNIALVATFTEAGGDALNYARVTGFEKGSDGKLRAVEVEAAQAHRRFPVCARAFVNATGPSSDAVRKMAAPGLRQRMRLSKGVHIVLPSEVLPDHRAMLIPKTEDGRVLFAIPWQGRVLVGTTEKEVELASEMFLENEEAEYLLRHLNRYLLHPATLDQVMSGTAGARPLINSSESKQTKVLARDHEVELDPKTGLISIMGGKWTTYRAMAEDTIDAVQKFLDAPANPCQTRNYPLTGSIDYNQDYWQALANRSGISGVAARHLAGTFGVRASKVLDLAENDRELALPLVEGLAPIRAEVVYAIREEMSVSIGDVLARRTGLESYGWRDALRAAPVVTELLACELGWPEAVANDSLRRYVSEIHGRIQRAGLAPAPVGTA